MPAAGSSAKSDVRRREIMAAAIECFAHKGFYGTTTNEIAQWAGISQPYLYRLYASKQALFAAVVDHVSVVMTDALVAHSAKTSSPDAEPSDALSAARSAYAALVADRNVLRFLMHANCAVGEPLIHDAVRRCYAKQVDTVGQLLGDDEAVRRWLGAGMVDNVVAVLGLEDVDEPWAQVLTGH